jgi:hypothetical protein
VKVAFYGVEKFNTQFPPTTLFNGSLKGFTMLTMVPVAKEAGVFKATLSRAI